MTRVAVAYLLLAELLLTAAAGMWFSPHYRPYERELRRGRRPMPIWKPFWMR